MKSFTSIHLIKILSLLIVFISVFSFSAKSAIINVPADYPTIQAAINAASPGDIINVAAGTYEELIEIDKPITLKGPNATIAGNGSRVPEAIIQFPTGAIDGSSLIHAGTVLNGVTIAGFDLRCQDVTIPFYHYLILTEKVDNLTIRNNRMYSSQLPIYVRTDNSTTDFRTGLLIEGNYIDCGPNVNNSYNRGMYIQATSGIIQENQILNTNIGIQYLPYGHTIPGLIQRNIVSAGLIGLYNNYQRKGAAQVTWSQNEVTVAPNDRAGLKALLGSDRPWINEMLNFRGMEARTYGTDGSGAAPQAYFNNNKLDGNIGSSPFYSSRVGYRTTDASATGITTLSENSFVNFNKGVINNSSVPVNATCNWWGSAVPATVAASFTGPVNYVSWLSSGVDNMPGTIGFQPAPNSCSGCPSGNVIQNTTTLKYFCSIQDAINDAQTVNGHTITVGAGTYNENIVVNKSLSILGPNSGINPCSGVRVAEAIVVPASSGISFNEIFHVAASNVTISGFTIDGDNPLITSGFSGTNGADIDAAEGVTIYETGINNLTATNNIIKNLSYFGITLYDYPAGVPSSGHVISNNKIQDLGTYAAGSGIAFWGGGVLLYNNQYAAVTNNCMDNVRLGVQTGNYSQANPGAASYQVIDGNTMTNVRRLGVFHNLAYSTASPFTVSNNSISGVSNINETKWDGVSLASLSVPSTTSGNIINAGGVTQASTGIGVWNVKNTTPASISGGSVTDVSTGIFVNNYDGYSSNAGDGAHATISSISINPKAAGTGIRVFDNPFSSHANVQAVIGAGVVINNGTQGLVVENASASVSSLGNVAFNGQSDKYIQLISNANSINATTATFGGNTGGTATLAQNFAIEDKITHAQDNASLGFVTVKAGEDFVTQMSGSVKRGVDNASNGWIVNVAAGTYNGSVTINKSLTLLGANASVSPCSGTRTAESKIMGSFTIASNGITIKGFEFTGANAQIASSVGVTTWSNIDIQNNWLHATTAQIPICHGLGLGGGIGSYNWTVSNNQIEDIQWNNATAIVLFNITNVVANNNCITHANGGFSGRRGINADGLQNATFNGNTINMGNASPTTTTAAPWAIQVSMSDRDVVAYTISGNTVSNVYRAIQGLSQRNLTGLVIHNNDLMNVSLGVDLNTGGAVPVISQPFQKAISIYNNNIVTVTPTTPALGAGVRLRNLHNAVATGPVSFSNVDIKENSFTVTDAAVIFEAGLNISTENSTCNWYGSTSNAVIATKITGPVTYIPYLTNGTDNSASTGFQPVPGSCNGPQPRISFTAATTIGSAGSTSGGNPPTVSIDFCTGASFTFSGYSSNPGSRVGSLEDLVSSGNVLYNGSPVPAIRPQSDIAPGVMSSFFSGTYGPYSLSGGTSGTIDQTYTPYYDVNNDGNYDVGTDILGSPIVLHYNIYSLSTAPTGATGTTTICNGSSTTLTVDGGSKGAGAITEWFTGSCGGTSAGTDDAITVSPTTTTTYYVRYKGTCNTTDCAEVTVTVNTLSTAPTGATGTTKICNGSSTNLTVVGGSKGTGAITEWFTGSCGGTSAGTGDAITVSPTTTTTYYVRYNGTCNTTNCATVTVTVNPLPTCSITAVPANNIYTGGVPTNIYLGYGPQSLTLNVTAAIGGPFTYSWSPIAGLSNTNTANPVFTATTAGSFTYTVQVTNSYGCVTTCSVTICVKDIRVPGSPANNMKVYVCHNGNTISVSTNSVASHIPGHAGDRLGSCSELPCAASNSLVSSKVAEDNVTEVVETPQADFRVNVYPNPSAYDFSIQVISKSNEPVTVRILDLNGKVRSVQTQLTKTNSIKVGASLIGGTYIAEVIQGTNRKTLKLVKLN